VKRSFSCGKWWSMYVEVFPARKDVRSLWNSVEFADENVLAWVITVIRCTACEDFQSKRRISLAAGLPRYSSVRNKESTERLFRQSEGPTTAARTTSRGASRMTGDATR
jgi:hypothetical protein